MKTALFGLMIAFVVATTGAVAQTTATTGKKPCYVDANNNKVCDKYESHACKGGNGTGAPDCKKSSTQAKKAETQSAKTSSVKTKK